jgi:hypothetical protein
LWNQIYLGTSHLVVGWGFGEKNVSCMAFFFTTYMKEMLIDARVQRTKGVREFQNKNTPKLLLFPKPIGNTLPLNLFFPTHSVLFPSALL